MEKHHLQGVAEEDSDSTSEEALVQQDPYIVALVECMARKNSTLIRMRGSDLEIDEIAQLVRIKYWNALQSRHIVYHQRYIYSIVQHEIADMMRRRKPVLPLLTNDDGELYMGDMVLTLNEEMANPEEAYLEGESFECLLEHTVAAIAMLPPRQRNVLVCRVRDALGDRQDVIEAFARYSINIELSYWPEDEADRKLLRASHSVARKKLRQVLNLIEYEYQVNEQPACTLN